MTPVSASQRAARMAPLASLDCSITDSRLSILDTPTLNSYFECDQLSDMVDDSLFEITNTGCLSSSVFRRCDIALEQPQQQMPSFLYSSYDYTASSRIPIAAQHSSCRKTSTRHNNNQNTYSHNNKIAASNRAIQSDHLIAKLAPQNASTTPTLAAPAKTLCKLAKPEVKRTNDKTTPLNRPHSNTEGVGGSKRSPDTKKSRLGFGSFLGGFFDGNSKEANKDRNTPCKPSQPNGSVADRSTGKTVNVPYMKTRDSIRVTNQRLHKASDADNHNINPISTSRSCNDFGTTCSSFKPRRSEVLLLNQSIYLQRPISASQLSHVDALTTALQTTPKPASLIRHQLCTSTDSSQQPVPLVRHTKSVKFCMTDQVLTRPASSNPRHLSGGPASIIKRSNTVVKSSTCSQTESSENLDKLLAKYDKNSELIREISEKLQLTDTIASPCSVLDALQEKEEAEDESEKRFAYNA